MKGENRLKTVCPAEVFQNKPYRVYRLKFPVKDRSVKQKTEGKK